MKKSRFRSVRFCFKSVKVDADLVFESPGYFHGSVFVTLKAKEYLKSKSLRLCR